MKYSIYQLANMHDSRYGFMGWDFAKDHGFNLNDYVCTYEGNLTHRSGDESEDKSIALELLFERFNIERPEDFKGHSLSVSDVVELTSNGKTEYYYCDSFRWENISQHVA